MKHSIKTILACGTLAIALFAGCGQSSSGDASSDASSDASADAEISYDVFDYVTLGDYEGLNIYKITPEVSDEDVQDSIDSILEESITYTDVTDRAVKKGDTVTITATAKIDGEEYENECYEDWEYDLYSDEDDFSDDFDDNVVGMSIGDTKTITTTLSDDYDDTDVAGKEISYEVTVSAISVASDVPTWTDSFVSTYTDKEYTTTASYEEYLKEQLLADAEANSQDYMRSDILSALSETSTVDGYPEALYDQEYESAEEELESTASSYGTDVETILTYFYGYSSTEDYVKATISSELLIEAVAEKLDVTLSDDEYNEALEDVYTDAGYDDAQSLEDDYGRDYLESYFLSNKVLDTLIEKANVTEVSSDEYDELTSSTSDDSTDAE